MYDTPLVSIVVCVFNGGSFLQEQLDSFLNQDYLNLEVVIVDDCSTDGSRSVLQSYANRYPQIKIHFNAINLGHVKNFQKAIYLANGKYIALSDQDDIWHPQKITKQVSGIGDHLLVYHDSEYIDENGNDLNIKYREF